MGLLAGKVVLITGATGGQGHAHAVVSAEQGANVILADFMSTSDSAFKETEGSVRKAGSNSISVQADVTSQSSMDQAVAKGIDAFGKIDILIANAGISKLALLWEMEEAEWNQTFDVNLHGVWRSIKAVAPHMIKRGEGSIILISSVDAYDAEEESTAYGVTKAGVLGLQKYAAYELGSHGIRVNAIAPGFVDTPMVNSQEWYDALAGGSGGTKKDLENYAHSFTQLKGIGLIQPRDIANAALYLNSELARYVTGATIPVDAGHLLVHRTNENPQ